jgi:hypothetical protein
MAAMEQLRWQLTILTTDEPPAPLDDPGGMADHLRDDVVVVHDTGDATRDKLRTLMGRLASHYADHVRQHALDPRGESAIRIGTVDIETWDLLRLNKDKCPLGSDGIDDGTTEPPLMSYDATTQQAFLAYLKSLLTNELNGRRELAVAAGALGGKHRAQIIADYYFARSVDQISLHKDTFGTTLFVALHYLNKSDMTGPEYIYDRWPIAGREPYDHGGVAITDKAWMRTSDGKQGRPRAPWSKNAKYEVGGVNLQFEQQRMLDAAATHFWPHDLIASLEAARAGLPTTKKVQMSELHPYGLISFVDELIYHSTPLTRNRTLEDSEKVAFQLVVTGGLDFYVGVDGGKAPMNLRRRMSFALNGGDFEPKTGFADKRTFLRLWITVAPKSWYTPWTSWKLR